LTSPDNVIVEKKGCIAIIKINNPPQNYLKSPVFIGKEEILAITAAEDVKGLIITGMGRHFSAGADLDNLFQLTKDPDILKQEMTAGSALLEQISELKIPVIAAINGVCWGGGLEIALSCHIRFASAKSLFAFPEINSGLMPGLGGIVRLVNNSGTFSAISTILSGEIFNAEKALKFNMVHQLTEVNVVEYSWKYLNDLVESKPKKVIASIMQAIQNAYKLPLHEALKEETRMFCELAEEEAARRKSVSL